MPIDSRFLKIDKETGDFPEATKRKLGDYLSRRTQGKSEVGVVVQVPDDPTTSVPLITTSEIENPTSTYVPPQANAQVLPTPGAPDSDGNTDVKKYATESQMNKWTFPKNMLITNKIMNVGENDSAKKRKQRASMLKDVLTVQDVLPDPVDIITNLTTGDPGDFIPELNPISLAMQAEIAIRLPTNRFSKASNPVTRNASKFVDLKNLNNDAQNIAVATDASTWQSRSKAYRGSNQQSISHRLAADLTPVLMPESFQRAMNDYHGYDSSKLNQVRSKLNGTTGKNSFTKEEVKEIERVLEAQYVPFYIQDLRTNEFLNFHAFVENVSDSYSANWSDTEGYGRMDAVQVYKGTTRSIGVDFMIVATSEKDFDRVWWTINRLVTMIYPQWSKGEEIELNGQKVIQPFSQVITSSPLVRLRVGDLIASNYSRFNLARNFGLGNDDMFPSTFQTTEKDPAINNDLNEFINGTDIETAGISLDIGLETMLTNPDNGTKNIPVVFASTVTCKQGVNFIKPTAGLHSTITIKRGTRGTVTKGKKRRDGTTIVVVKLEKKIRVDTLAASALSSRNPDAAAANIEYVAVNAELLYNAQKVNSNIPKPTQTDIKQYEKNVEDSTINLSKTKNAKEQAQLQMILTESQENQQAFERASDDFSSAETKLKSDTETLNVQKSRLETSILLSSSNFIPNNFGSPQNYFVTSENGNGGNSIIRSFEDSSGRGLAGSIRSIGFDWAEAPWETSQGSRAPIYCKVSLQFNPIHDLPMGLDYDGMPRAVPYPVGETVRQAFFPELDEQSVKDRETAQVASQTFGQRVAETTENVINGYLGKSIKRIL
jgi:hypothetical protein